MFFKFFLVIIIPLMIIIFDIYEDEDKSCSDQEVMETVLSTISEVGLVESDELTIKRLSSAVKVIMASPPESWTPLNRALRS